MKLSIKLIPEGEEKIAHGVFHMERNNRGTWERTAERTKEVTSEEPMTEVVLGLLDRLVIEGSADHEYEYDTDQNVVRIIPKEHVEEPKVAEPKAPGVLVGKAGVPTVLKKGGAV